MHVLAVVGGDIHFGFLGSLVEPFLNCHPAHDQQ
jgi:hypothetical protein